MDRQIGVLAVTVGDQESLFFRVPGRTPGTGCARQLASAPSMKYESALLSKLPGTAFSTFL